MDENNDIKNRSYRRSTRRVNKNFRSTQSPTAESNEGSGRTKQQPAYDENYRFERRSHISSMHPHQRAFSARWSVAYAAKDEDNENDSYSPVARSPFFANSFSYLQLLVVSFALSLSFYSFPLIQRVATGTAAFNLSTGFAMNHGVSAYNDLFGGSGPLFYLVNQIGTIGGSTWILWLCEILALWASGLAAFDILQEMLGNKSLSTVTAAATMLALAGISLGADQAILFAMPFALYGVRVLNRYFVDDEAMKDEVFILFGISGALASLFFPLFLVIWLLGVFGLFGRNIILRNFGRGFYQFLSGLFGFLLVYSLAGYYTLTTQIFYPAIDQAVIIPFTHWNLSSSGALNLVISLSLVLLFGLESSWFYGFHYVANGNHRVWTAVLLIVGIASLVFVSFMKSFSAANAMVVLPFVFMYVSLHIDREARSDAQTLGPFISKYIRATAALPLLGLVFLLVFPFANSKLNSSYAASEKAVAGYIQKNSTSSDRLILLANSLEISRLAGRAPSTTLPPDYYPATYAQSLDIAVATDKAKFIVTDITAPLSDSIKTTLTTKYTTVKFSDNHFKIFQLK